MTDPKYLHALAGEHNAAGAVLLRPDQEALAVLVRVFIEGGTFRFVIQASPDDPAQQQLMIAQTDLARLLGDAQPID
jgi:hypothetical protein